MLSEIGLGEDNLTNYVITGLAGFGMLMFRRVLKQLDDCEDDRKELWEAVAKQNGKTVDELKKEVKDNG